MYSVAVSVVRCRWMRTSGWCVSTLGRTPSRLARKAVGHGIFDAQGGKVQAGQRAVLGGDLDLEGALRVNQISQATSLAARYRSFSLR